MTAYLSIGLTALFILYSLYLLLVKKQKKIQLPFADQLPFLRNLDVRLFLFLKLASKGILLLIFLFY